MPSLTPQQITETLSHYDQLIRQALDDGNVVELLTQQDETLKNFYKNCKRSTEPDQQAAFNAPFFLHRIIPDFRRLGDNGDLGQFLKHQRKNLRKHDEREAAKKRKPAGPTNMSLAIHVLDREVALTQPSPSANAGSAEIPVPSEGQPLKPVNTPTQELPSQQPNGQETAAHARLSPRADPAHTAPIRRPLPASGRLSNSPPVAGPGPKTAARALAAAKYAFAPLTSPPIAGAGAGSALPPPASAGSAPPPPASADYVFGPGGVRKPRRRGEPVVGGKGKGKTVAGEDSDFEPTPVRNTVRPKVVGKGKGKAVAAEERPTQPTFTVLDAGSDEDEDEDPEYGGVVVKQEPEGEKQMRKKPKQDTDEWSSDSAAISESGKTRVIVSKPPAPTQTYSRPQPEPTGKLYEPPCVRCTQANRECREDKRGGPCVDCRLKKYGCGYAQAKKVKRAVKSKAVVERGEETEHPSRPFQNPPSAATRKRKRAIDKAVDDTMRKRAKTGASKAKGPESGEPSQRAKRAASKAKEPEPSQRAKTAASKAKEPEPSQRAKTAASKAKETASGEPSRPTRGNVGRLETKVDAMQEMLQKVARLPESADSAHLDFPAQVAALESRLDTRLNQFQQHLDRVESRLTTLCEFFCISTVAEPAPRPVHLSTTLEHRPDSPLTSLDGEGIDVDGPAEPSSQQPPQAAAANAEPQAKLRPSVDPAGVGYMLTATAAPIACLARVDELSTAELPNPAMLPPIAGVDEPPVGHVNLPTTDLSLVPQAMPPPPTPRPTTPTVNLIPPTPDNSQETLQTPSILLGPTPPPTDSGEPSRITSMPQTDPAPLTTASASPSPASPAPPASPPPANPPPPASPRPPSSPPSAAAHPPSQTRPPPVPSGQSDSVEPIRPASLPETEPAPVAGSAASHMARTNFRASRDAYIASKPWRKFFQLRDERNKKKLEKETTAQRQTRLNRERQPPVRKVDVFLWDWSDEDPEQLVRAKVDRREGEDILSSYTNSQLVYDSYSNVWDACEYFGPNDDSDDEGAFTSTPAAPAHLPSRPMSPPAPPGPRRGRSRTPLVLSVPGPVTSPSSVGKRKAEDQGGSGKGSKRSRD